MRGIPQRMEQLCAAIAASGVLESAHTAHKSWLCALLPNSPFSHLILVVWNQP